MWQTFWGGDMARLSPSNRRAVVPGAWRMEVSPRAAARDDVFLHVLEVGDRDGRPLRIEAIHGGDGLEGAIVAGDTAVLVATAEALSEGEATLPDVASPVLLVAGLAPAARYDLQLTSGFAPGSPVWQLTAEASDAGVIRVPWSGKDGRLRMRRVGASERSAR
jgi:hypothetical protein